MRVFLLTNLGGSWRVSVEVLAYDKHTNVMRVKCKNGTVYDRIFLPDSKYNRSDFKLQVLRGDDDA